jgi:hypothetical protein
MKRHVNIPRPLLIVFMLVLAGLACNLGGGNNSPAAPRYITTPITLPPSPAFAIPTATPQPTPLPFQTQVPPTQINCTPYTYWPVYYVRQGDTLGQIAARTGSTIDALVQANCLANGDLIYVDQPLYVPVIPATLTPVPTSTLLPTVDADAPIFTHNLTVDAHWVDSSGWMVTYYDTVRVNAGEVLNADRVDFYVDDPGGASAIHIGQDLDPWDGAFWDYSFPAPGTYTFMAVAENEHKQVNSNAFTIRYDPNFVPPEGRFNVLIITPNLQFDGSTYLLQSGATVTIDWPNAPRGATEVDFFLAPTGTGMSPQPIGADRSPADGATITWGVLPGVTGHIQATAAMPDGSTVSSQLVLIVGQ